MAFLEFLPVVSKLIDRILPDKAAADAAKLQMMTLAQQGQLAELDAETKVLLAGADNVKTEAASTHWLASCWRPLLMLTFGSLIVARFLGWTAAGISEAEYIELWSIIKLGIGGYTMGRTVEKVAPMIAGALGK